MSIKNIETIYTLSPIQSSFLIAGDAVQKRLISSGHLYCTLRGNLSTSAFQSACQAVVARQPLLRTSFVWKLTDKPLQLVHRNIQAPLEQEDWREMTPVEQSEQLDALIGGLKQPAFDPSRAPLIRMVLCRIGESEYRFVCNYHRLLLDSQSSCLLLDDLLSCYEALLNKQELPPRPKSVFQDYVAWLKEQDVESNQRAWQAIVNSLGDPTPVAVKQEDHSLNAKTLYEQHNSCVSAKLTDGLRRLAQEYSLSLDTIVQAAWAILLSRYSGEEAVNFGATISTRPQHMEGSVSLLGPFTNTLPVQAKITAGDSVLSLLKQMETNSAKVRNYGYVNIWQAESGVKSPGDRYEFESNVEMTALNSKADAFEYSGLHISDIHHSKEVNSPLTLKAGQGEQLSLDVEYDCGRFCAAAIARMSGHLETLLEGFVANAFERVDNLPLVKESERRQILEWNSTGDESLAGQTFQERFEAHAEKTPDAEAIVFECEKLTYEELNKRANQLAHYLRKIGVRPETPVGISLERSAEAIIAVLGVLKAGGAYVPLDPDYPLERLSFILDDAQIQILLTHERLLSELPSHRAYTICLDSEWSLIAQESDRNPVNRADLNSLAYVIYTSGSTGQPKGVLVEHRGLSNLIDAQARAFNLSPSNRVLQFASLSFDASIFEIVMALAVGAELHLAKREVLMPGRELIELLRERSITNLTIPPTMLSALPNERLPELQTIIVAGESCSADLVERWGEGRRFFNAYGPTEATVWSSVRECFAGQGQPDIGRPIPNTQIYILDKHLQMVPVGVAGQLHIGGVGLARGYLNKPQMTAERFIPNPFSDKPGERLYGTGDLGRYTEDGRIEFLGRCDHQMKIRGFRIEPGEIESVLTQHPGIREAVVLGVDDETGDKRLVAYFVTGEKIDPPAENVQRYRLPNDLEIFHINKNETEAIYKEIFEDKTYFKHGITIEDGDCIFDVGANTGLFTLSVCRDRPGASVFAFEPIPPVFEVLRANMALHNIPAHLFNCGLSNRRSEAAFTYYPAMSAMSGLYANAMEEERTTRAFLTNQDQALVQYADELLEGKFDEETFACQLTTLSDVIAENNIERIDLLKVDVEKSELDVLEGIAEEDWGKIKQIVLEAHDINGRVERIESLLEQRGFNVVIEQDSLLKNTNLYNVYAIHSSRHNEGNGDRIVEQLPPRSPAPQLSSAELAVYLREKLPDYMVPSIFMLVDELPRTPNGKVDRRRLPAPKQERHDKGYVAPRDIVEFQLARIWEEVLGIDKVGVRDVFFDIGGHSILAVRLMAQIQKVFGQDLPLTTLFQGATVEHLAAIIRKNDESPFRSPLVTIQPEGSNPPLILIHPAGGSVLCYFELARHLAPDQPVFGFQSPGLYEDREPYASLEDMAASYNKALRAFQPEGPYFLGGISMGGILAYEMAQQLIAEGEEIALLAMLDTNARNASKDRRSLEELFQGDDTPLLVSILPKTVAVSAEYLRQLKVEDRLVHILEKLKEKKLVPGDFGLQQIERYANAFKLNVYTVNRYALRPYAGRITLFLADEQSEQTSTDMTKGWGELAAGGVEIHGVPGNHMSMLAEPHVRSLAKLLKQLILKA